MSESNESCDRKPLIALWYLHRTTEMLREVSPEDLNAAINLQKYYLRLCRKYGVTVDQVSDSLEITPEHASQLLMFSDR